MEKNIGLNELIYDYYESRILFGHYKYGDPLPSISQICDIFQVGRNTVRAAFSRLNEKGYILSEERKASIVVYQGTPEDFEKNQASYFVPREDGIRDFSLAAKLLFLTVWEKELKNSSKLNQIIPYRKKYEKFMDEAPSMVKFCVENIFPMNNGLLSNLYWECLRYVNFLHSDWKAEDLAQALGTPMPSSLTLSQILQLEENYYSIKRQELMEFINVTREKYHLESIKPIPFKWNIYRQRPQVRYSLAAKIIGEIFWGRYPIGSFLPPLTDMAEQYGVSLITVRRTLSVLNSLGVTTSYRGSGTKVCMESKPIDLSTSDIHEDLRLHRESLQFLALTIRGVLLFTLEATPIERYQKLAQDLSEVREKKQGFLCFGIILDFICEECPSAMVRECYSKLEDFIVWGCIMVLPLLKSERFTTMHDKGIQQMEIHLSSHDIEAFANDCQALMEAHLKNSSSNIETFADDWDAFILAAKEPEVTKNESST